MISLNVVAGQKREVVGSITPSAGMLTSAGVIERVTGRTVFFANGSFRRNLDGVTVRHTEALKYGYPTASGCTRRQVRYIVRGDKVLAA